MKGVNGLNDDPLYFLHGVLCPEVEARAARIRHDEELAKWGMSTKPPVFGSFIARAAKVGQ